MPWCLDGKVRHLLLYFSYQPPDTRPLFRAGRERAPCWGTDLWSRRPPAAEILVLKDRPSGASLGNSRGGSAVTTYRSRDASKDERLKDVVGLLVLLLPLASVVVALIFALTRP